MQLQYNGKKDLASIENSINIMRSSVPALPDLNLGGLIYGDNFYGMARMLPNYQGKIDLIYIDPPFNTQGRFYSSEDRVSHISHSASDRLAYSDKL